MAIQDVDTRSRAWKLLTNQVSSLVAQEGRGGGQKMERFEAAPLLEDPKSLS